MVYTFSGAKIHYDHVDCGAKRTLVFLHGWGRDCSDFFQFSAKMEERNFLYIDFPPFGKSEFSPPFSSVFTYVNMLISLCEHLGISSADFIAHSFGGRILMLLCVLKTSLVQKCIFVGTAGLKPRRTLKYKAKVMRYKIAKRFNKHLQCGSKDYLALPMQLRPLFKNIVNTHLDEFAKKIDKESLIFWGEKDEETPLYMAKRLNRYIKNSRLYVVKDGSHFCFIENALEFFKVANNFLKEEK